MTGLPIGGLVGCEGLPDAPCESLATVVVIDLAQDWAHDTSHLACPRCAAERIEDASIHGYHTATVSLDHAEVTRP